MTPESSSPADLRHRAAKHVSRLAAEEAELSPQEALQELRVHQAELELQNQELRETHAALERSRDRYFNLFDLAPVAYFVFNQEHRLQELNLAAAELLGRERGRLKGHLFTPHVAPGYREIFHDHLNQVFAGPRRHTVELRLRREDDTLRYTRLDSLILPGELDAPPLCLTACTDLTERRQAEAALQESELRFRQLAGATDHVFRVFSVEPEEVIYVSPAFETVWGRPAEALHRGSRDWLEAVQPTHRQAVTEALGSCLRGQADQSADLEYQICRPDGSTRWILETFRPIRDGQGSLIRLCAIARDVTERKLADERRLEFERKLLETQKLESLGVMAGGIAHDFNNLLTGIMGNAGLAKLDLAPGCDALVALEHVETAARRAAELCSQMLAYSGRGRFIVEALDLNAIIQEMTHLMRFSINKEAVLKLELAPRTPPVLADATQLRQVIMNLVINAGEALGEETGYIHLATGTLRAKRAHLKQLHLSPELPEGEYVTLEVRDTGCGMTPEVLARIFDPFYTTKFTGRGLGLAAVLGIIRGHRGGIKVTSHPGRGSAFRVYLPTNASQPGAEHSSPRGMQKWRASGTVLLVDDEEVVRQVTNRILKSFGLSVIEAVDGREAVVLFERHAAQISCVLLDLTMPHLTGEQTFAALRVIRPEVPILLMSGYSEQEAVNRFPGKALSGFLQKPFASRALREQLERVLTPVRSATEGTLQTPAETCGT